MDGAASAGGHGRPMDGRLAPAHSPPTTTLEKSFRLSHSRLDGRSAPAHTAHSADDDDLADLKGSPVARLRVVDATTLRRHPRHADWISLAAPRAGGGEPKSRLRDDLDLLLADDADHASATCSIS